MHLWCRRTSINIFWKLCLLRKLSQTISDTLYISILTCNVNNIFLQDKGCFSRRPVNSFFFSFPHLISVSSTLTFDPSSFLHPPPLPNIYSLCINVSALAVHWRSESFLNTDVMLLIPALPVQRCGTAREHITLIIDSYQSRAGRQIKQKLLTA